MALKKIKHLCLGTLTHRECRRINTTLMQSLRKRRCGRITNMSLEITNHEWLFAQYISLFVELESHFGKPMPVLVICMLKNETGLVRFLDPMQFYREEV